MIVDPVGFFATGTLPIPLPTTPTTSSSHHATPMPSVMPSMPEYQEASGTGHRTLWVVFIVMLVASGVFSFMSWNVPIAKRLYYFITTMITITAAISYFGMATGMGVSYHHIVERESHKHVPDTHKDVYREVYWARYVDWSLTTPLLLLDLCLLAGLNGGSTIMAIAADLVMILTGLFAAFGSEGTPQKWGWYTIACIAYLVVVWHLFVNGRPSAVQKGEKLGGFFTAIAGFALVIWTAYPIVWGVADGSRVASVDAEIIAYAILDILAKPVFGAWLLLTHANMPESNVELGGYWSNGLTGEGQIRVGDDDEGA